MQIIFTKLSDEEHRVKAIRADTSFEESTLNSRSFLRHDFAHLAAELVLGLQNGYWGSVAKGSDLSGKSMKGEGIVTAEAIAVRVQGLMREEAGSDQYEKLLTTAKPDLINSQRVSKIYEKARQIQGHWRATPYAETMLIEWAE
ncbi:MAG: hypothetical protein COA71_09930 [SAR86 cluster bacterium]|uniref:Uncharacterized protein n=1 Tax=SAR86 cluster bacterium TaxID=2030880 RepID=A0A2A5CBV5_9GAMM|nr:MAG: hypothetical protein COA71_09930 [SAR86 cluster bacterium]